MGLQVVLKHIGKAWVGGVQFENEYGDFTMLEGLSEYGQNEEDALCALANSLENLLHQTEGLLTQMGFKS